MRRSDGYKNLLITILGVIIFLSAGIFAMLLSPSQENRANIVEVSEKKSRSDEKIFSSDNALAVKIPEPEKPKPDWYIYVTGEVKKPGYYKISADARVFHAIEKAGGFTKKADQTSVNMAEFLADGISINVKAINKNKKEKAPQRHVTNFARLPRPQTAPVQLNETNNSSGLVDVNTATAKELEQLNGVGPAIAKRIVEYRNTHGKFSSPEDLIKVKGIGSAKLERMRPQILIR